MTAVLHLAVPRHTRCSLVAGQGGRLDPDRVTKQNPGTVAAGMGDRQSHAASGRTRTHGAWAGWLLVSDSPLRFGERERESCHQPASQPTSALLLLPPPLSLFATSEDGDAAGGLPVAWSAIYSQRKQACAELKLKPNICGLLAPGPVAQDGVARGPSGSPSKSPKIPPMVGRRPGRWETRLWTRRPCSSPAPWDLAPVGLSLCVRRRLLSELLVESSLESSLSPSRWCRCRTSVRPLASAAEWRLVANPLHPPSLHITDAPCFLTLPKPPPSSCVPTVPL